MDKNISREKLWQQCNCQLTGFSEYFVDEKPTDSNVNPVLDYKPLRENYVTRQHTSTTNVFVPGNKMRNS